MACITFLMPSNKIGFSKKMLELSYEHCELFSVLVFFQLFFSFWSCVLPISFEVHVK